MEMTVAQLTLDEIGLPPAYDLKARIRQEHERAELQRIDSGDSGCGCSLCQALYQRTDMSKYGARVKEIAGVISVTGRRNCP